MIPKLKKNSGQLTPPLGVIYLLLLRAMYNLCTKFEMSIFTHSRDTMGPKSKKCAARTSPRPPILVAIYLSLAST